jgi:hypothetical protein
VLDDICKPRFFLRTCDWRVRPMKVLHMTSDLDGGGVEKD